MSDLHITKFREGFPRGYTQATGLDDITQMEFGILKLAPGEVFEREESDIETQLVILTGAGVVEVGSKTYGVGREDVFRQNPHAFDLSTGHKYRIEAKDGELEVAVIKTKNKKTFAPLVMAPKDVPGEQRGKGLVGGAMHRIVKAIFDDSNAPQSNLVVGEVVNFPGRWSSYPPHGHPQPEIYYYRFDKPQGFGISVFDDEAYILRNHDAVRILNNVGHSQVAAPAYAMWYLWFIRHLEGNRYSGFTFYPEHDWINKSGAKILTPEET